MEVLCNKKHELHVISEKAIFEARDCAITVNTNIKNIWKINV